MSIEHLPAPRIIALTGVAMIAFAANSVLCRLALAHSAIDPGSFTAIRIASGAITLCVLLMSGRSRTKPKGSWLGGAALFTYAAAFSLAYTSLSAGAGALILFGAVQASMLAIGLWRGERLSAGQWLGFVVAVTGLAVLLAPGAAAPSITGAALMLTAGAAWGVYTLFGRTGTDPLADTAGNFLRALPLSLLLLVPVATAVHLDTAGVVHALLSGAVASGLGYTIWYSALPGLSAAQAASVQLSVPAITALAGVAFLGEPLGLRLLLASAAVLGGIALVIAGRSVSR